jgi:hypothetical protein
MLLLNQYTKKGGKTIIHNYRPISIITGFATVFEMVIYRRLNNHFTVLKILCPQQFGFQKDYLRKM